jgi:hypothetical protein
VRLKGGDPFFIFGRGSEEAAALAAAQIPYEVVPGITAATAAGVYAGISLTHREFASAVAFITGHEDPQKAASSIDYDNLARFAGTLVFYMGLHRLRHIVDSLIAAGKHRATPACVIGRASTPRQQTVTARWAISRAAVDAARLRPPSLIIIGECVGLREQIAWFEKKPLFGRRIGITRPAGQADACIARALELGAEPVLMPTIRILPPEDYADIDAALSRLAEFDWLIFTSANGVAGLLDRLWEPAATRGGWQRRSSPPSAPPRPRRCRGITSSPTSFPIPFAPKPSPKRCCPTSRVNASSGRGPAAAATCCRRCSRRPALESKNSSCTATKTSTAPSGQSSSRSSGANSTGSG